MRLKLLFIVIVVRCGKLSVRGQTSQFTEQKTYFSEQIYVSHKEYTYNVKKTYKIGKNNVAKYYYK